KSYHLIFKKPPLVRGHEAGCGAHTPVPAAPPPGDGRAWCTPCRETAGPEERSVPGAAGRAPGSESLAPVLPGCGDDARLRLRCPRSPGRSWCPGCPASRPPARTALPAGEARRCARVRGLWEPLLPAL